MRTSCSSNGPDRFAQRSRTGLRSSATPALWKIRSAFALVGQSHDAAALIRIGSCDLQQPLLFQQTRGACDARLADPIAAANSPIVKGPSRSMAASNG